MEGKGIVRLGPGASDLSTRALAVGFVGRVREMNVALSHLLGREDDDAKGRTLVISGDSGTGKTYFARELMLRANTQRPDALFLYIDVANDEYQSSRTITALLKLALVPGPMAGSSRISIPDQLSLEYFRRQTRKRGLGRGFLRFLAQAIAASVGIGPAVSGALGGGKGANPPPAEDELVSYLSWVARRHAVYLAVDNIQFLNLEDRLTLESVLQRTAENARFIVVNRTTGGFSELDPPPRCFADALVELTLGVLTREETAQVVARAVGATDEATKRLADDIFIKTGDSLRTLSTACDSTCWSLVEGHALARSRACSRRLIVSRSFTGSS